MSYLLPIAAGFSFALQFCVNKYYETRTVCAAAATLRYSLFGKLAAALFFALCLAVRRAPFFGNGYTVLVGAVQAALNLIIMFVGFAVMKVGSLGLYTVSMMIGGMAVPAVFGAAYFGGKIGWARILAFCMIAVAVALTATGEKKCPSLKALLLYAVLFVCNGAIGIFSDLHANAWGVGMDGFTFAFVTSCVATALYAPLFVGIRLRRPDEAPQAEISSRAQKVMYVLSPYVAGILNGLGNLLILVSTAKPGIGSMVTFPLVTGGTILCTVILSRLLYGEKISVKVGLGMALIAAALILYAI